MVHGDCGIVESATGGTRIRLPDIDGAPVRTRYGTGTKGTGLEPHFKIGKLRGRLIDHSPVRSDLKKIGRTVLFARSPIKHKHDVQRSGVFWGAMAAWQKEKKRRQNSEST